MPIVQIIVILIVIGVLMWLVHGPAAPYIWPVVIKILDVVVIVGIVLWYYLTAEEIYGKTNASRFQ